MEWSNAQTLEFLDLYQSEPAIWNPKHLQYKNRKKAYDAWTRISYILDGSIEELKAKKESLMSQFRLLRRRKEASAVSETGEDVFHPTWFAYEKMDEFLGPVYDCRPATNAVDRAYDALLQSEEQYQNETDKLWMTDNETQESTQADDERPLNTSARRLRKYSAPISWRKKRRLASEIDVARNQIKQTCATLKNVLTQNNKDDKKEVDDCDLYGQLLAKKLRNYTTIERHILMHDIDGLLLQKPPRSAMISPSSSHSSSSAPSSINRHAPVCISTPNEPSSVDSYYVEIKSE